MSENERKQVSELTDTQLRAEIALATGEIQYYDEMDGVKKVIDKDGRTVFYGNLSACLDALNVPNWPADDGDAIRLVRDIVATRPVWLFEMGKENIYLTELPQLAPRNVFLWVDGTDARALSELALLALRQMGG